MGWAQAIFLSVIQGLTEFLPVSSSGHLVILQKLFRFGEPPVLFVILLHVGTLGSVIFYFRKELKKLTPAILFQVFLATIPAIIVGFFLKDLIEQIFSSLILVGLSFLITAGFLLSTKFIKGLNKDFKKLDWRDSLFIGCFQALAILPGVSRSGSTIASGLWRKLTRETAFYFSFYLAIPAILGALVLKIPELISFSNHSLGKEIIGMLMAGLMGYFSLGILEKFLKSAKLFWFGFYCLFVGVLILIV